MFDGLQTIQTLSPDVPIHDCATCIEELIQGRALLSRHTVVPSLTDAE